MPCTPDSLETWMIREAMWTTVPNWVAARSTSLSLLGRTSPLVSSPGPTPHLLTPPPATESHTLARCLQTFTGGPVAWEERTVWRQRRMRQQLHPWVKTDPRPWLRSTRAQSTEGSQTRGGRAPGEGEGGFPQWRLPRNGLQLGASSRSSG